MSSVYLGFLASSNTPIDQICILSAGASEPRLNMSNPGRTDTITLCHSLKENKTVKKKIQLNV